MSDEDDSLMNYSSFAVYLNIMYHLIVGTYYAIFWNDKSGIGKHYFFFDSFKAHTLLHGIALRLLTLKVIPLT